MADYLQYFPHLFVVTTTVVCLMLLEGAIIKRYGGDRKFEDFRSLGSGAIVSGTLFVIAIYHFFVFPYVI